MKISNIIPNISSQFVKNKSDNKNITQNAASPSFKSIYVQDDAFIGHCSKELVPPKFYPVDALFLNDIANMYPNQDCFIKKGYGKRPMLEYREKPPQVQIFSETADHKYRSIVNPDEKYYETVPLLLYKKSETPSFAHLTRLLGFTTNFFARPSLPNTVKAGFEVHKKLLEKKYQILEFVKNNDSFDLGTESIVEKAHKAIENIEMAVIRYLLEDSFVALEKFKNGERAEAMEYSEKRKQIADILEKKRKIDVTTSITPSARTSAIIEKSSANSSTETPSAENSGKDGTPEKKVDFCDAIVNFYENAQSTDHINQINEIVEYMIANGLVLE